MTASTKFVLFLSCLGSACAGTRSGAGSLSARAAAQKALEQNDGRSAVALLEPLFAAHPADLELARELAEAHALAGSEEAFLARLAAQPSAVSSYMEGLVRFSRVRDASGPAIAAFRRAIAQSPQEPEFHYRLGLAHLESERYAEAVASLRHATRLAPSRSAWRLPFAHALAKSGDDVGAVAIFREILRSSPSSKEVATAVALLEEISSPFALLPQAVRPQIDKALEWLEQRDVPQEAIVVLEEVLRDYPDLAVAHALLGLASERLDDSGRAVDELRRAIELAPGDGRSHFYLAEIYLAHQRAPQAEAHFEKAVERNPALADAWFRLGDLAVQQQNWAKAKESFEMVCRLTPESVAARGKLALVHQMEGNWSAAAQALSAVLDRDPDNIEFAMRLGLLHTQRALAAKAPAERRQAAAEARPWLRKVLEAQSENAVASRALEQLKTF